MNQYQLFRNLRLLYPTITRLGPFGPDAVLIRTDDGVSVCYVTDYNLKWEGPTYTTVSLEEARVRHQ